jgi:hypothetical protein
MWATRIKYNGDQNRPEKWNRYRQVEIGFQQLTTIKERFFMKKIMLAMIGFAALNIYAGTKNGLLVNNVRVNQNYPGVRTFQVNNGQYLDTGCPNSEIWTSGTDEAKKSILALLLTARASGLTVTIDYTISGGYCYASDVTLE